MGQLILGAIMISFSAVFVRLVTVAPTVSAFYRMAFGGGILLAVVLLRGERVKLSRGAFLVLTLAAFFFALDLIAWHRSILYIGPGIATLIANFQVFVLAVVGVLFLKEHLTPLQWGAIALAMAGLGLLVGSGWEHVTAQYHWGVLLGLLSAAAYAGYLLTLRGSRTSGQAGSAHATIAVISLVTAVILAAAVLVEGQSFAIPTRADWGWLLLYGLVPQVLGWVMISNSILKVGAAQVGLVLLLQPACAFIWDGMFFGRHFTAIEITGAVLALVAIYLGSLKPVKKQPAS